MENKIDNGTTNDLTKILTKLFTSNEIRKLLKLRLKIVNRDTITKTYIATSSIFNILGTDMVGSVLRFMDPNSFTTIVRLSKSFKNLIYYNANYLFSKYTLDLKICNFNYLHKSNFYYSLQHRNKKLIFTQKIFDKTSCGNLNFPYKGKIKTLNIKNIKNIKNINEYIKLKIMMIMFSVFSKIV